MTHILFKKHHSMYEPKPKLATAVEYFRDQANRQDVLFVNKENSNDPGFVIRLNQREVSSPYSK